LEKFISTIKYETVLFEKRDMPFQHDKALEEPCYAEINNCYLLVLIIGGSYGSLSNKIKKLGDKKIEGAPKMLKSVILKKYEPAISKEIPTFIFVERNVIAECAKYKENKGNESISYAHVDNTKVFELLDNFFPKE
jgi:hypothetical protein